MISSLGGEQHLESVRNILEAYGVFPIDITKITERLYYIKGNKHQYALKKSNVTETSLPNWLQVYRTAHYHNLQNILPVYLTTSGDLYVKKGTDIYYLTPWIPSDQRTTPMEKIYQNIGFIHAKTSQKQILTDDERSVSRERFLLYQRNMAELRRKLINYVEDFEANHFMSPVELLVCTQYRDLVQVFYYLEKRLNQYLENLTSIPEFRISLCHGMLQDAHVLYGNQLYFTNWEHARFGHPITDLTTFIKDRTMYHDSDKQLIMDKFKVYLEEYKLENNEMVLLVIYLLDPTNYLKTIDSYTARETSTNMIDYVIQLQRIHRQLVFGVRFSEFIEEEFEFLPLDESES